jgi:acetoin utilization protein AcuB
MKVRDIMTYNVVTISSNTPVMEALKIMEGHGVRRLPVVDKGKLVGVVTIDEVHKTQPSPATSLNVWEMNYLLSRMMVKEIMHKGVLTIDPEENIEHAMAIAQSNKVGSLIVVEKGKVVGILTSNDLIYKVLNPMVGVGSSGKKLYIENCSQTKEICQIMEIVNNLGLKLLSIHTVPYPADKPSILAIRVATKDASGVMKAIEEKGYTVSTVNIKAKA